MKQRGLLLLFLIIVGLALALPRIVAATPAAPRVVINPTLRECDSVFYWIDECGKAVLPPGWEFSTENTCPAGYKATDLAAEWTKFQDSFCCQARGGDYCPPSILMLTPPAAPTPPEERLLPTWLVIAVQYTCCAFAVLILGVVLFLRFRREPKAPGPHS